MTQKIYPVKTVDLKNCNHSENLLIAKPEQIDLTEPLLTIIAEGGHVTLDFGKEMRGGVKIYTLVGGKVRLRFGESLSETAAELGGEKNATNDHAVRDMTVFLPAYSGEKYGGTGFRFLRIDALSEVAIKSVVAYNEILDIPAKYDYLGSDERIKDIFDVAKRTIDLCCAGDYVWDGVKRDRLVWIGDMHPEMLAVTTLYGRLFSFENSLDFVRSQTPLPGWMNNYPMYSMWWMSIVADYREITGADDFAIRQLDYMEELICQLDSCVLDSGELNYPAYFVDWQTSGSADELHGVRAINIMAVKKAIKLFEYFGRNTDTLKKLLDKLMKIEILPQKSKQVLGLKYFAVGLTEEDKKLLVEGGANGMSTFMSYYILKAVASFDKPKAIEMMKEFYGAMLDKGATTFFEDFDMSWVENSSRIDEYPKEGEKDIHGDFGGYCYVGFRHSLCHGWSAGVIKFIEEEC